MCLYMRSYRASTADKHLPNTLFNPTLNASPKRFLPLFYIFIYNLPLFIHLYPSILFFVIIRSVPIYKFYIYLFLNEWIDAWQRWSFLPLLYASFWCFQNSFIKTHTHTRCLSFCSAQEKYGPKTGHSMPANATLAKRKDTSSKPSPDFDTSVGLSTRPPWSCR